MTKLVFAPSAIKLAALSEAYDACFKITGDLDHKQLQMVEQFRTNMLTDFSSRVSMMAQAKTLTPMLADMNGFIAQERDMAVTRIKTRRMNAAAAAARALAGLAPGIDMSYAA